MVAIKVEIDKKLELPKVKYTHGNCLSNSDVDCNMIECENCLFDVRNYKILLEQQKGGDN